MLPSRMSFADFAGSQLSVWIDGQPVLEDLLLDLKLGCG